MQTKNAIWITTQQFVQPFCILIFQLYIYYCVVFHSHTHQPSVRCLLKPSSNHLRGGFSVPPTVRHSPPLEYFPLPLQALSLPTGGHRYFSWSDCGLDDTWQPSIFRFHCGRHCWWQYARYSRRLVGYTWSDSAKTATVGHTILSFTRHAATRNHQFCQGINMASGAHNSRNSSCNLKTHRHK